MKVILSINFMFFFIENREIGYDVIVYYKKIIIIRDVRRCIGSMVVIIFNLKCIMIMLILWF